MTDITLELRPLIDLTNEQFYKLCQVNPDIRLERSAKGELIIVPLTGGKTGRRNTKITTQLENWSNQNNLGVVFDSSTEFQLPRGGNRSPATSWVRAEVWELLSEEEQEQFPPICPDFVVEVRSRTDSLEKLQDKMKEYLASGLRLGWLIDPKKQCVEVYRQGQEAEVLYSPTTLSGESVLPGFMLDLSQILAV